MILGGMGPVDPIRTTAGKLFASFYALYSGLAIISVAGRLLAPIVHRFLHRFQSQNVSHIPTATLQRLISDPNCRLNWNSTRTGAVASALDSKLGSNLAFANQLMLVQV